MSEQQQAQQVNVGDVVRLRSGGPALTVTRVYRPSAPKVDGERSQPHANVTWIGDDGSARNHTVPVACLVKH